MVDVLKTPELELERRRKISIANKCKQFKEPNQFHKNNRSWDKLYVFCKNCINNLRKIG